MRVAVALPSYEVGAAHRVALDAALAALAGAGVELEGFAEATRLRAGEPSLPFPVHHYLRLPDRHRDRPYDTALYPLGRDFSPCQPAWILSRQFPAVVWILDPVLHHLAVAGMSLRGRWDAHLATIEAALGARARGVAQAAASWWSTPRFYGRFDPVPSLLAGQRRLLAASDGIRDAWTGPPLSGVVPLPAPQLDTPSERPPGGVVVLAWNVGRPEPLLRALQPLCAAAGTGPPPTVFLPELEYEHRVGPLARRLGGLDAVRWRATTDRAELTRVADEARIVAFLRDDLTAAEHALIERAIARGALVVGVDSERFGPYPPSAVPRLAPGWELVRGLPELVEALDADGALAAGIRRAARSWLAARPSADDVARELSRHLRAACARPLERVDVARSARARVAAAVRRSALPPGLTGTPRALVEQVLVEALGARWLADAPDGPPVGDA